MLNERNPRQLDRPLHRLLVRAGLLGSHVLPGTDYTRGLWFSDCALKGHVIVCPDLETLASIERCFLSDLRLAMSDVTVRLGVVAPATATPPAVLKKSTPAKFWR